jgi:hypothetical protein
MEKAVIMDNFFIFYLYQSPEKIGYINALLAFAFFLKLACRIIAKEWDADSVFSINFQKSISQTSGEINILITKM